MYYVYVIRKKSYFSCWLVTIALWTFLVPKAAIKIIVRIVIFSSFSHNFCNIWWFFQVLQHIWNSQFRKIIKYTAKSLEIMKKNHSIILLLKWSLLVPKIFSVHWEIKSLRRDFHLILVEIFSVLDEPKVSPKTEKIKTWNVERLTQSWNVETKLARLEHNFI